MDANEVLERLRNRSKPPPERFSLSRIPWGGIFFILVLGGAIGWGWYHFEYSSLRAQDYTLPDQQGHLSHIRIDARNGVVLKYTLLSDDSIHYKLISSLFPADREFVLKLPDTLTFSFPFKFEAAESGGAPALISVEGRNASWVRYVRLDDHTTHYAPLTAFSDDDQTILSQLPPVLTVTLPIERVWTDLMGKTMRGRVTERSYDVVKLFTPAGKVVYFPIKRFSTSDQDLARLMPMDMTVTYPFDCTLTDNNNKPLDVRVESRSANFIRYTLLSDGQAYGAPITNFSDADREFLRTIPAKANFSLPLNFTLVDAKGRSFPGRIEARGSTIVKFVNLDSDHSYYWPISAFSTETQDFFKMLPLNLRLAYPVDATLTSQAGQDLSAHILGRDAALVKFVLPDGNTYNYPLTKLSTESQDFLLTLPANMADASTPTGAAAKKPLTSTPEAKLESLRRELAAAVESAIATQKNSKVSLVSNNYNQDPANQIMTQNFLEDSMNRVESICKQIEPLVDLSPKRGNEELAKNIWLRAMRIIKSNDQLRFSIVPGSNQSIDRSNLHKGQADLIEALNQINALVGAYCPPAAAAPAP